MKEDAEEARERAKTEQENAVQKRKEEREELEKPIAESRNGDTDTAASAKAEKQHTGIFGLTLRAFLCCYVLSILYFILKRN